jgi:hypothetical protein
MDDRIAYMSNDALDDEREPFLLEQKAQHRLDNWSQYERERQSMLVFKFVIEAPRPFPRNAIELARGIGVEHGIQVNEVSEASRGILVKGWFPEDWSEEKQKAALAQYASAVKGTFAEVLRHESPGGMIINNTYHAQQVAAQGPGAQAIGNVMIQQWNDGDGDAEQAADELRRAREELQKSLTSALEDAIEIGAVAEAERAAKARDLPGVMAALKKFGSKAYTVVETLGLSWLKAKLFEKTGIALPQLPPGDKEKE